MLCCSIAKQSGNRTINARSRCYCLLLLAGYRNVVVVRIYVTCETSHVPPAGRLPAIETRLRRCRVAGVMSTKIWVNVPKCIWQCFIQISLGKFSPPMCPVSSPKKCSEATYHKQCFCYLFTVNVCITGHKTMRFLFTW